MQSLHERLPAKQRYPLTPREITELVAGGGDEDSTATRTLLAHFAYGGLTGAIYGLFARRARGLAGACYGIGVWCVSYLGWAPALGLLTPAVRHPARRNALMIAAHVIWGMGTAWGLRQLTRSHGGAFAGGPLKDLASRRIFASGLTPRREFRHGLSRD
jgi:hypothetical protein